MEGGFENYVRALCAHQRHQGLDPSVLTLNRIFHRPDTFLPAREVIDGVPVRRIPFRGARRLFLPLFNPAGLLAYDIVHMHAIDQLCDVVCASRLLFRRPLVLTTHGGFFHTRDLATIKRVYFQTISRLMLRQADAVVACSANDQAMMREIGIAATLVPNAVVAWDEVAAGPDLVYVGRLAASKQVDRLIDFIAALRRLGAPRRLHIVGDDFDRLTPALREQISRQGVGDDVHLHGYLSRDQLRAVLASCGFFVSASRYEGFGMSMIEAMTAGLIPFVQANESFSELVGRTNPQSLTDFADPDVAAAFLRLEASLTDDDRRRARAFALQFSWPELANRVLAIYRHVSTSRRPALATRLAAAQKLPTC
jgi:alpha-1,3-mannosyltransferase